ncbi:hypothetical protein Plhal304r1_c002g0006061 [Plasmopara halstedii]
MDCTNAADRVWTQQVLPALCVFYQEYGHCNIKTNFLVPKCAPWTKEMWGLNLGTIVKQIRAGRSYVDQSRRDWELLNSLQFLWDSRDVEWQDCVLPALVTFVDEFGDEQGINLEFVVPLANPWPKETWGFELGLFWNKSQWRERYFVQLMRDTTLLESLGYEMRLSDVTWESQVIPLLRLYSTMYPEERTVQKNFIIPHQQPWPRKMWGLPLGQMGAQNSDRLALEFSGWKSRHHSLNTTSNVVENANQQWKIYIYLAFETFVKVFGHCKVESHFQVPLETPWPKETWGLQLGARIADYIANGTEFEYIGRMADRIDTLGYTLKLSQTSWDLYGAPLLSIFSHLQPRTVIPENFVIPSQAPWSEATWGIQLGIIVRWNRQHMTHIEDEWRNHVLTAAKLYKQEYDNHSIEETFVIPSQSPWPTKTWNMHLALILRRLNNRECYDGHVALARTSFAKLEQFLQYRRREAWQSILITLQIFFMRNNHCDVMPHFVVSNSSPWPKLMWNVPLGQIVEMMKTMGTFFKEVGQNADQLIHLKFSLPLSISAYEKLLAPLIASYANLHPRDTIPLGFTIPSNESWPTYGWGINLSVIVQWNLSHLEAIERDWRAQVLLANDVYQYENGNKILRDSFVVPSRSPWPYKTWGRELRRMLTCVQVGQPYNGHVAIATYHSNAAVVISGEDKLEWKTSIFPALHTFAMVFGHCSVPETYVVPSRLPWPEQSYGLELGNIVAKMEQCGMYFAEIGLNADRLETFGFRYKLTDIPWQDLVDPLLEIYANQYSHKILPEEFVVPPKAPWPVRLYGLRLGKILAWSSRFTFQNAQWKEFLMPENTTKAGEFGYCKVSTTFEIPSEFPWPKPMWTLQIKDVVSQLYNNGDLFLSGGLSSVLASKKEIGFVLKLATDHISFGEPICQLYTAVVEQMKCSTAFVDPQSCLGKHLLSDGIDCGSDKKAKRFSSEDRPTLLENDRNLNGANSTLVSPNKTL